MASHKHHLSFTDYLSLYIPHPLRPPLPRDLRSPPPTVEAEDSPLPSLVEPGSCGAASVDEEPSSAVSGDKDTTSKGGTRGKEKGKEKATEKRECKSREGYHVALILTNSGSTARDHLASERTFLAYVRTSLALASTGVALVQLFTIANMIERTSHNELLLRFATPLGATMIVLGLIVLLLGCLRYFAVQTALTRGVFPAARHTVAFLVVVLCALTTIIFAVLVRGRA